MTVREESYRNPADDAVTLHVLPADLTPDRAYRLLQIYRQLQRDPGPESPPAWYLDRLIAALDAIVAEATVSR